MILVTAPPGYGKSVLASHLIREELQLQWPEAEICYYFFKDLSNASRDEESKEGFTQPVDAVCTVLHQILLCWPDLIDDIASDIRQGGSPLMQSISKLQRLLHTAVRSRTARRIICVLDALDEAARKRIPELLEFVFSDIQKLSQERSEFPKMAISDQQSDSCLHHDPSRTLWIC